MADTSDREYILQRLRERETAIREDFARQIGEIREISEELQRDRDELASRLLGCVDGLRASFERLSTAVLEHVQSEANADARRDATLAEHGEDIQRLAFTAGGVAGARKGRESGARWGGFVGAVIAAIVAYVLERLGK